MSKAKIVRFGERPPTPEAGRPANVIAGNPMTSTQNGVLAKASNPVPPSQTTISATVPAGMAPRGRRSPMRDTAPDSPPNASPSCTHARPHRSAPAPTART